MKTIKKGKRKTTTEDESSVDIKVLLLIINYTRVVNKPQKILQILTS